ncbi:MAG: HD domain-containing protein [Gammaproteobacteria bacterium]|nr:HD domain-containing protein [Gammaproteobacteria bacterium]
MSQLIQALSHALDLTEGQPRGHCVRCTWIGMHIGMELGLDTARLSDLHYTLLLKDVGCSSNASRLFELYGYDDLAVKHDFKLIDSDHRSQLARFVLTHAGVGEALGQRLRRVLGLAAHGEDHASELIAARCERGSSTALRLGLGKAVADGIFSLDEHWNGKGKPQGLHGDAIPLESRIALVAQVAGAVADVVDAKSTYTYGHSTRVALYSDLIAQQMGLPLHHQRWLRRAALLHDLGKLAVSNAVLEKPGSLTPEEWNQVKAHPRYTEEILMRIGPMRELARVAGAHHERLDGKGYPKGLCGDEIALETRIITVADIFDAITAERPYRGAIEQPQAIAMMEKTRDSAVDGGVLDALIRGLGI